MMRLVGSTRGLISECSQHIASDKLSRALKIVKGRYLWMSGKPEMLELIGVPCSASAVDTSNAAYLHSTRPEIAD
jgi:hypothetical protein